MTDAQIDQLQLDYQGRAGSLMAVDDHVGDLVKTLRKTDQLKNTVIVFVSDNGWLQGQHRITGDKFLPYEESLRVPLIIRGPGVPKDQTVHGQVSNIDFAPTLLDLANAKAGRTQDGVSLLPTIRKPKQAPRPRARDRGAGAAVRRATSRSTPGTGPTPACARTGTPTSSGPRPARRSSTTAPRTRTSSTTSPPIPPTRRSRPSWLEAGQARSTARARRAT